jgi:hypothetical protein
MLASTESQGCNPGRRRRVAFEGRLKAANKGPRGASGSGRGSAAFPSPDPLAGLLRVRSSRDLRHGGVRTETYGERIAEVYDELVPPADEHRGRGGVPGRARRRRVGARARHRHRADRPSRWPPGASRCTGSTRSKRWSRSCARSRAAKTAAHDGDCSPAPGRARRVGQAGAASPSSPSRSRVTGPALTASRPCEAPSDREVSGVIEGSTPPSPGVRPHPGWAPRIG